MSSAIRLIAAATVTVLVCGCAPGAEVTSAPSRPASSTISTTTSAASAPPSTAASPGPTSTAATQPPMLTYSCSAFIDTDAALITLKYIVLDPSHVGWTMSYSIETTVKSGGSTRAKTVTGTRTGDGGASDTVSAPTTTLDERPRCTAKLTPKS